MPNRFTFIYALQDPRDQRIRYVGKSDEPLKRLQSHIQEARRKTITNYHKVQWIRGILKIKLLPQLIVLERVNYIEWQDKEEYWMNQFNFLTNIAEAGQGGDLGAAVRHKISKSLIGRKRPGLWTPESRAKLSKTLTGRKFSKEHKQKISTALKGKPRPPSIKMLSHLKKGNKSKTGQKLTEETKMKISQSQKRRFSNDNSH